MDSLEIEIGGGGLGGCLVWKNLSIVGWFESVFSFVRMPSCLSLFNLVFFSFHLLCDSLGDVVAVGDFVGDFWD